eukprot:TRINITY_DN4579_c0_g3_i1.p1 TRINITY_DN4579_c0_g3~~TRINITY_DN4579_c0_g3_i1.p1  ORF type:complete len:919 (+),score=147.86 TRINITY_DN4579_c0_g3_i1:333-2759(+)
MDQVMVTPQGHPGENPDKDVSVPINWAYNHHYMWWITGNHSELRRVSVQPGDPMAHGASTMLMAFDLPSARERADPSIPTSQWFSEGNGGESRKSFHGYPKGYAQLIDSPTSWHVNPMQVDTRNRDCGATPADIGRCTKFTPGIEPRQARWGRGIPKEGTNYSGLLECPCNGNYGGDPSVYGDIGTKQITHDYMTLGAGACEADQKIRSASECFAAAGTLGINATQLLNKTVTDEKLPPACSVVAQADGSAVVNFNSGGRGSCSSGAKREGRSTTSRVGVSLAVELDGTERFARSRRGTYCSSRQTHLLKAFPMESRTLRAAHQARERCEAHCSSTEGCWGCSVDCAEEPLSYGRLNEACQWNAITSCGERLEWSGSIPGDISELQPDTGVVKLTITGPADVWFGVGLNATLMLDEPYAIVANDAGITEQKLGTCGDEGAHCAVDQLAPSVTVVSNTVTSGKRTIVMTRPMQGKTKDYFTFDPTKDQTIRLITAVGHSQKFEHHQAHGPAEITLTSLGQPTCVCDAGKAGQLCEFGGANCGQFVKDCVAAPIGSLLEQRNPTCSSRQYIGGLHCCRHGKNLLDHDQEIPPQLLRYHIKYRIWFQEYVKDEKSGRASHYNLDRFYWTTEAQAGEYDIPPAFAKPGETLLGYPGWPLNKPTPGTTCTGTCPDGPDCECEHTIVFHWDSPGMRLLYAGGHCHAPSCISIELYRNDTGTPSLLCRQLPYYGQGNFPKDKFDEAGYVVLPPCLWGSKEEGLEPSQWLPKGTPLISIKKNRNTDIGHFGEMASWQMRGVNFPDEPLFLSDPTFV